MYGYHISTDYRLMKESIVNLGCEKIIYCYRDDQICQWKQSESKRIIGANRHNTILVYQFLGGKYIIIKDMGEFFIKQNHIKYHISSHCFSEEAICTTISTHIIGNILIHDSYLLHATALMKNHCAICFIGCSGAGKSTLSLKLSLDYGYTLISDDMTSIIQKDQTFFVTAGNPYTKIWSDTFMHFRENNKIKRTLIKNVYKNEDKFIFCLPRDLRNEDQFSLKAIVLLRREKDSVCDLRRINSIDSFSFLYNNNYIKYACLENERIIQAKLLSHIVFRVPIYLFTYPNGYEHLDDVAQCIENLTK